MADERAEPLRFALPSPYARSSGLRGLHAQTVETLGARIIDGTYAPGSPLPLDDLLSELNVSRTVLREALRVLADKGLVDSRQKRGTQVTPRSSWSLLDSDLLRWMGGNPDRAFLDQLAEVRAIVEPAGARLAALRRTDVDLEALHRAFDTMDSAGEDDLARTVEADVVFHRALLDAAHNEVLSRMQVVIEAGLRARDLVVHVHRKSPDHLPVHRAILTAVEGGDPIAVVTAMQALLERAQADTKLPG